MHDHFEQGDGTDADVGEVVRVGAPWAFFVYGFLVVGGVGVEGVFGWVDELDGVLELWGSVLVGCVYGHGDVGVDWRVGDGGRGIVAYPTSSLPSPW